LTGRSPFVRGDAPVKPGHDRLFSEEAGTEPWTELDRRRRDRLERSRKLLFSGSAALSFSAVADSGLEHNKARYNDPFMYLAPTASAITLGRAALQALHDAGQEAPGRAVYLVAGAAGLAGFGFHLYNIGKRTGGFDLLNLMYGAPLIAPGTLLGAGAAGLAAEGAGARLRGESTGFSGPAVALGTAGAMLGTVVEVGLLHYRGAYQNPYMLLPVTIPPLAAAALLGATARPSRRRVAAARTMCGATAALGLMGTAFHAYGIHRNMGGWRNWSQMILQGPPLPAPPGFVGVALAGLGALDLLEAERCARTSSPPIPATTCSTNGTRPPGTITRAR
jgi:hypothetical protein